MSAWLLRALLAGGVMVLAAELAEGALATLGRARRWVWVLALGASALLPWLARLLPPLPGGSALTQAELARLLATATGQVAAGAAPTGAAVWPRVLLAAWVLASAALLALLAYTALRLGRARRGWVPAQLDGSDVLLSPRSGPAVVGLLRPRVVLPAWVTTAPAEERRMALIHEREHVRAGDPWLLAGASVLTALLPWNPAVWWAQRRLRVALESDCDARVLASGVDRVRYGTFLLGTAARQRDTGQLALALVESRTSLERRIRAMTRKLPKNRAWAVLPLAAAALLAVVACEVAAPTAERNAAPPPPAVPAAATTAQSPPPPPPPAAGKAAEPVTYRINTKEGEETLMMKERSSAGDPAAAAAAERAYVREPRPSGEEHAKVATDQAHVFLDGVEVPGIPRVLDERRIDKVEVLKAEQAQRFLLEHKMTDDGKAVILITMKKAQ